MKITNYDDYKKVIDLERLDEQINEIREDVDLEEETETLFRFFKLLYPDLNELNKYKKIEEILQISLFYVSPKLNKDLKGTTKGQRGISSYNNTMVENFLKSEIDKYFYSKVGYNVYYSLGLSLQYVENKSYDPNATEEDKNFNKNINKKYIKTYRNNNNNTLYLGALAIDLDASNIEELKDSIKRCDEVESKLNINSIKINTSLLGQQRIYLLDKTYTDKTLLEQFMKAFYETGVDVDKKVKDISRVLRLPIGLNTKAYDPSKNIKDIYKVDWLNKDEEIKRNDPKVLLESLKELRVRDFVEVEDKPKKQTVKVVKKVEKKTKRTNNITTKDIDEFLLEEDEIKVYYNSLSYKELPKSIIRMLSGNETLADGYRNKVLRALNYYLDFIYPLPLTDKQKHFILDSYALNVRLDNRKYQVNYVRENQQYISPNDPEIVELYGETDFSIYKKSDYIIINNFLLDKFKHLKGDSFKSFLKVLIYEAENDSKEYTKEDLLKFLDISTPTLNRYLKDLTSSELFIKKKARAKQQGDKTKYYINPKYKDFNSGYEKFRAVHIESDMEKLKQNELKLYYYLLLKSQEGIDFAKSKRNIANDLGISHPSITGITNKLEELGYIKKISTGQGFYQLNSYRIR